MARMAFFARGRDGSIDFIWSGNIGRRWQTISTQANGQVSLAADNSRDGSIPIYPAWGAPFWRPGAYSLWVTEHDDAGKQTSPPQAFAIPAAATIPAPTAVSARRVGTAATVAFTPGEFSTYIDKWTLFRDVGGQLTELQSLPATGRTFNIAAPYGPAHRYVVRGSYGSNLLITALGYSNQLVAIQPPAAPTNLAPNGTTAVIGNARLSWRHNPLDESAQTKFQIRYRTVGSTSWTTLAAQTSNAQFFDRAFTAGEWEWQVCTWGTHANASPWSAVATLRMIALPTATILTPISAITVAQVATQFQIAQAQNVNEISWDAQLVRGTTVLETISGSGTRGEVQTASFATWLTNASTYQIRVRGTALGLTGPWQTRDFTTDFALPEPPRLSAAWSETAGGMSVEILPGLDPTPVPVGAGWPAGWTLFQPDKPAQTPAPLATTLTNDSRYLAPSSGLPPEVPGAARMITVRGICPTVEMMIRGLRIGGEQVTWVAKTADELFEFTVLLWGTPTVQAFGMPLVVNEILIQDWLPGIDTDHLVLSRSIDSGTTWELVRGAIAPTGGTILDLECLSNGETQYRAESWSNLPSVNVTSTTASADSDSIWLHALSDTLPAARLPYNPALKVEAGRERGFHQFGANRVAWSGEASGREISYDTVIELDDAARRKQMEDLAMSPSAVHVHRDPEGRRVYGVLSPASLSRDPGSGHGPASYSLTETGRGLPWGTN